MSWWCRKDIFEIQTFIKDVSLMGFTSEFLISINKQQQTYNSVRTTYFLCILLCFIIPFLHQFLCSFWVSVLWFYDGISYNSHNEGEYNNLFTEKIHKFLVMQHCFRIEIFMSDWTLNECGEVKGCREGDLTLKLLRDGVEHCLLKALSRPDINSHDKERQKA